MLSRVRAFLGGKRETVPALTQVAFLDWIKSADIHDYDERQQYRDFRAVLIDGTANDVQRRRVLGMILYWGNAFTPMMTGVPIDPLALAGRAATKDLCERIINTLNRIPSDPMETDNG